MQNGTDEEVAAAPPPPVTEPPTEELQRRSAEPPIKTRPLALKPGGATEQPKLKAAAASSRRIELPPAFLFPETEPPPADLSPHDVPLKESCVDEPDRLMPNGNDELKLDNVDLMNNINQEHLCKDS
jgi:hypothetical protein